MHGTMHGLPPALGRRAEESEDPGRAGQGGARGSAAGVDPHEEDVAGTFWEPWKPKLGDRVRVHLSAECRQEWPPNPRYAGHLRLKGHIEEWDGLVGTVATIEPPDSQYSHHPYFVMFDQKQRCPHHDIDTCLHLVVGARLAGSEMISLEEQVR